MPSEITEQKILQALKSVPLPHQNTSLGEAGAVSGIVIKGGNVGFTIEIAPEIPEDSTPEEGESTGEEGATPGE